MQDVQVRRLVKRVARWEYELSLRASRALRRRRGGIPYDLAGACQRCARCCEAPAIQGGPLTWYLPTVRRVFVWWQRAVNGFELVGRDVAAHVFVFRCTHFDLATRSCDSYDSRPGMCRDYPRALLDQPAPALFAECGYRPIAKNAERLLAVIRDRGLTPAQERALKKGLRLE
jgi:hypothetical protein